MKYVLILVAVVGAYFAYQHLFANPMVGQWQSDTEKSMSLPENGQLSALQREGVRRVLGKMRYEVTGSDWTFNMDGTSQTHSYEITGRDGNCFEIKSDLDESRDFKVCMINDDMHVVDTVSNFTEVYTRLP